MFLRSKVFSFVLLRATFHPRESAVMKWDCRFHGHDLFEMKNPDVKAKVSEKHRGFFEETQIWSDSTDDRKVQERFGNHSRFRKKNFWMLRKPETEQLHKTTYSKKKNIQGKKRTSERKMLMCWWFMLRQVDATCEKIHLIVGEKKLSRILGIFSMVDVWFVFLSSERHSELLLASGED